MAITQIQIEKYTGDEQDGGPNRRVVLRIISDQKGTDPAIFQDLSLTNLRDLKVDAGVINTSTGDRVIPLGNSAFQDEYAGIPIGDPADANIILTSVEYGDISGPGENTVGCYRDVTLVYGTLDGTDDTIPPGSSGDPDDWCTVFTSSSSSPINKSPPILYGFHTLAQINPADNDDRPILPDIPVGSNPFLKDGLKVNKGQEFQVPVNSLARKLENIGHDRRYVESHTWQYNISAYADIPDLWQGDFLYNAGNVVREFDVNPPNELYNWTSLSTRQSNSTWTAMEQAEWQRGSLTLTGQKERRFFVNDEDLEIAPGCHALKRTYFRGTALLYGFNVSTQMFTRGGGTGGQRVLIPYLKVRVTILFNGRGWTSSYPNDDTMAIIDSEDMLGNVPDMPSAGEPQRVNIEAILDGTRNKKKVDKPVNIDNDGKPVFNDLDANALDLWVATYGYPEGDLSNVFIGRIKNTNTTPPSINV